MSHLARALHARHNAGFQGGLLYVNLIVTCMDMLCVFLIVTPGQAEVLCTISELFPPLAV